MTVGVDDELRIRVYPGDDTATPRAYGFKILDPDDLRVTRTNADGSETLLVRGTHYTVSGAGNPTGGDVTPLAPIATGTSWRIEGNMALDQPTDYTAGDDFPAESHERGLDRSMIAHQEARRDLENTRSRALLMPFGEVAGGLPSFEALRGKYVAVNADDRFYGASGTGADGDLRGDLASEDPAKGGALVSFWQDVDEHAMVRSLLSKARERKSLMDIAGATDTERLQRSFEAWPRAHIILPYRATNYVFEYGMNVPADTRVSSEGMLIEQVFDGALFTLANGATLDGLDVLADGENFPNSVIAAIAAGQGKQSLINCRFIDSGGPAVDFLALNAGSQFFASNLEAIRYNSPSGSGRPAIRIPNGEQLTAVPRGFFGLRTGGQCTMHVGGSNDTFITGTFVADLTFDPDNNTRGFHLDATRWANQAGVTIYGHGIRINAGVSPAVTIAPGADNVNMMAAYFNQTVTDESGNNRNLYTTIPVASTPVVRGDLAALATVSAEGTFGRTARFYELAVNNVYNLTHNVDFTSAFFWLDLPGRPDAGNRYEGGLWLTYELSGNTKTIAVQARCVGSAPVDVGGGVMKYRAQLYDQEGTAIAGAWVGSGWKFKGLRGTLRYSA
ncbi:hypothetical protein [Sphingopyxis terrae]|uniref:hypothetical protein n=1 Tax=Sphingopyxis terrae TaxID=33052 RepID=UPI003F822B9A